jgi:hypothetical protein
MLATIGKHLSVVISTISDDAILRVSLMVPIDRLPGIFEDHSVAIFALVPHRAILHVVLSISAIHMQWY